MSTIGYSWTPMDGFCAMFFRCVYGLIMFSVHVFVCFFLFCVFDAGSIGKVWGGFMGVCSEFMIG